MPRTEVRVAGLVIVAIAGLVAIRGWTGPDRSASALAQHGNTAKSENGVTYSKSGYDLTPLSSERIKQLANDLSPQERQVILQQGTERAFTGALCSKKEEGLYACRLCGLPLFSSEGKFESGTGWPSYFAPIDPAHVRSEKDNSLGMARTEILCARCGGHLGHVFEDGPEPTGLRYCTNSASLRFFRKGQPLPPESQPIETETAYFAGGCFWGIEDRFQQIPGVMDAVSGYQGGDVKKPSYRQVCTGGTGHAESVRVTYDPTQVTYRELLEWFFKIHDPTQLNRQGPDVGTQYRSAIFAVNDQQKTQAQESIAELEKSGRFGSRKIVTEIHDAAPFYEAEEYHQDYHAKHGGSCALPKQD